MNKNHWSQVKGYSVDFFDSIISHIVESSFFVNLIKDSHLREKTFNQTFSYLCYSSFTAEINWNKNMTAEIIKKPSKTIKISQKILSMTKNDTHSR
jgi:hypothetical protein